MRQLNSTTFSSSSLHRGKLAIPIHRVTAETKLTAYMEVLQTISAVLHSCCLYWKQRKGKHIIHKYHRARLLKEQSSGPEVLIAKREPLRNYSQEGKARSGRGCDKHRHNAPGQLRAFLQEDA